MVHFLKKPIVYIPLIALILIVGFVYIKSSKKTANFQFSPAEIGNVLETVSVTGTVSPVGKADLSFEKAGVISSINVAVGDAVKLGDPIASIDSASDAAALSSAQATLADMSRPLTSQEYAVAETAVVNAKRDALNSAQDSFAKAQSAVVNYADTFFTNPQSANPTISIRTPSDQSRININNERVAVSEALTNWSTELSTASTTDAKVLISNAQNNIVVIKAFINDLSNIVNSLNPGNAGLSQAVIDNDVTTINTSLSIVNTASDSITQAETELATAVSNYNLKVSGNSADSIAAEAAKVQQAQASLAEDTIISPLDGIVTAVIPSVGEFASVGTTAFSVQSKDGYKIEAFVPEADIAKVSIGDTGSTTLDAYGSNTYFDVVVTAIDPAETVIEGVPTYKVTLLFAKPDSRIRSGMTANLDIFTHERYNVLEIPYRAISITATSTTVNLVNPDGVTYTSIPVVTGLKGSDGSIEVVSGLKVGDKVVTYIKS